jgi:rhodanese-related sulfurtransferase
MADEKRTNIAYTTPDKASFIKTILAGLGAYPRYYAHMGQLNKSGPEDMKIAPIVSLSTKRLKTMLSHDEWIIDIRDRKAYAAKHPHGAAGFELADSFSTYAGWIIPWGDSITLVGDDPKKITEAQMQLGRIGMDAVVQHATDDMQAYFAAGQERSYPVKNFKDVNAVRKDEASIVLDVRTPDDWKASHISESHNIPLYEILERMNELPRDKQIWVHCASGYRASIAASLIDRTGRSVVLISDSFSNAQQYGLTNK